MVKLRSEEVAEQLISEFSKTGDLRRLLLEVSDFGQWFGRFNKYNRKLFEQFLIEALDNVSNRVPAPTENQALRELLTWIERVAEGPEEQDVKALVWKIAAHPGLRFVSREFDEEIRCPGCNWGTLALFALENEEDIEGNGLCGQCCMETIVAEQIKIPCEKLNLPAEIVEGQLAEKMRNLGHVTQEDQRAVKTEKVKA